MRGTADVPATPAPFLIADTYDFHQRLNTCPSAQTFSAYLDTPLLEHVIALGCKRWSCRYCAERRIRQLAAKTRDAQPNRMLTLTVDPRLYSSPREAFDCTRRLIPVFFSQLRALYGPIEYLRATELTKNGWPHYHFLVRSAYLPHTVVRDTWAKLTGATIVDVRSVDRTFRAYTYLVKYLAKLHKIDWTERHLSFSRAFFPPKDPHEENRSPWLNPKVYRMHPSSYLLQTAEGQYLTEVAPSHWTLDTRPLSEPENQT